MNNIQWKFYQNLNAVKNAFQFINCYVPVIMASGLFYKQRYTDIGWWIGNHIRSIW